MEGTAAYCGTDHEVHNQISYDVKYGAGRPNPQHEFADGRGIPFPRFFQKFCIYIIPRNCSAGDIVDQVQQNQMDGSHRQERQECRCCQYGEHVPEVGGSCHFDVFDHVGISFSAFDDALFQYHQVFFQQDNICGFFCDVYGSIYGDTYIGCFHGSGVIDAIAHVANAMTVSRSRVTTLAFCRGESFAKMMVFSAAFASSVSVISSS